MHDETVVYREFTSWAGWVRILLWGTLVASAVGTLMGMDEALPPGGRILVACALLGFGVVLERFLGGLTVVLTREGIEVGLGRGWPLRTRIPYSRIRSLESVTYRPVLEFGGWGFRGGGRKRAWTARGNEAVVLYLEDDRDVYIGSDHPRRLEERIRTLASPST